MTKNLIISFFLLFLVSLPILFSMYTIAEKKIIERRMEKRLEEENLQTITLEASSVVWLKKDKEILINNAPFDIKKITLSGHKIIISGLYDVQEKQLREKLAAYHHEKGKSSSARNSLLLMIFAGCCKVTDPLHLTSPFCFCTIEPWQNTQDAILHLYYEITTPPPRVS